MFCAYVLYSQKLQKHYYGHTSNIKKRLLQHNLGLSYWTRRGIPWKVIYEEYFANKADAEKRERFFKSGKGREFVRAEVAKSLPPKADLKNIV